MTLEQYDELFYEQGGGCAICGSEESGRSTTDWLHVDHDHVTGEIRGLLCNRCNVGLGSFTDDLELLLNAVEYLRSYQMRQSDVGKKGSN